jgi:hypothetical protein
MKLSKALKHKNILAHDVELLKGTLRKVNSYPVKQVVEHDARTILTDLRTRLDELVAVKTAIAVSNAAIYGKIFRLAELKGLSATLAALPTKAGVFVESGGGFGAASTEVEYVAQLSALEVEKLVAELQAEMVALQDDLDEFNASTEATA